MAHLAKDTHPDAEKLRHELLRQASPTRKLAIVAELNETTRLLMLAGLRRRYPDADEDQIHRKYAHRVLGKELADKVYGPLDE